MLTPQQLQQLKEAMYTACPELKEIGIKTRSLRFGCEVKIYGEDDSPVYRIIRTVDAIDIPDEDVGDYHYDLLGPNGEIEKQVNYRSLVDLGHPIQLHHVLRAMYVKAIEAVAIDAEGNFRLYNELYHVWETSRVTWNLTKPFDEQEPEVREWLYKLIVGEEK